MLNIPAANQLLRPTRFRLPQTFLRASLKPNGEPIFLWKIDNFKSYALPSLWRKNTHLFEYEFQVHEICAKYVYKEIYK